jgi:predicted 2-oxoglutarate/Fe(II)-dependent dioxygenase YbiX
MPATAPLPPLLGPGDAVPWFRAKALSGADSYVFDTAAGRHILLLLLGSAGRAEAQPALRLLAARRALLDDERACFFGVSIDPEDAPRGRIRQLLPGIRWFLDRDRAVSRLLRAESGGSYRPHWLLLDPMLRVRARFPLAAGEAAFAALEEAAARPAEPDWAPVLMAPDIFEPELCRRLVELYEKEGGEPSGFMREAAGRTVLATDAQHKLRSDCTIESPELRRELQARIVARLVPMVSRAFQFEATRMERYLIGCYTAGAGHFRPHRDNTTRGTAHRRFAVTINLNAGDYEGGDLRFPEYGPRTYCPPTGGAVVFSCSLLHEATPVTSGTRYAFLPFLYDEAAAQQREENNAYLSSDVEPYRRG